MRAGLFLIPHLVQGRKRALAASPPGAVPALPGGDAEGGVVHPSAFSLLPAPDASFQEGGSPASHRLICQKQRGSFDQGTAISALIIAFPARALFRGEGTFPLTLSSLRAWSSAGKAHLSELSAQRASCFHGWELSDIQ